MSQTPLNIKLRCTSWQQLANIHRRDLSRHAIFLKASQLPPLGTPVRIDLTLPTESMIVLAGVVAEHVPEGGLGGRGPGIDIKLNTIPESALWLIETALASAAKQTGAIPVTNEAAVDDGQDVAAAEDELLAALTSELDSLRRLNPFQVLGVGYEAGDAEIRAAFAGLTKRYHPDRFTRYTSQELRGLAAEIFILIRDAYRRLGDEASRAKALQAAGARPVVKVPTLRPGPSIPPPPIAGAKAAPPAPPPRMPAGSPPPPVIAPPRAATADPPPSAKAPDTERRPMQVAPPSLGEDPKVDFRSADGLLEAGRYDEALAVFKIYTRKNPGDRTARAGIELAEGLRALAQRDRLEAAQRFEAVLEIDPTNERAARELAEMRRMATNERRGLLSRLMGKKE
ncbi:MAG: DnaJ domain-containing protein [Myxococcales bacterium]|nr:DnaJ domain-containing protein [Myxococcales bacterium]MBK7196188.1 DnaJ domain-containing protein [Myxococcales bacterium]MBP6849253.1 DnaJ domain-containing protein [Kofleriaceae bacterium]